MEQIKSNVRVNWADWLPTSRKEMDALGWAEADIILFTGDAYVDHPSFGIAVIGRILQAEGYKVAIVPQPNWRDDLRDFKKLGTPRLFFGVASGNMDSMINHYTANKRLRSDDSYSPGGKAGYRPDYAVSVYGKILKQLFPQTPLIIGGIEASLRRLSHYDYWSNTLKPSILFDSLADLLVYGMGEKAIVDIAKRLDDGFPVDSIIDVPQTAYITLSGQIDNNYVKLNSYDSCLKHKEKFGENFKVIEIESNKIEQFGLLEEGPKGSVVVNPPYPLTTTEEIDSYYALPYTYLPHPRYNGKGPIPAYEMIKNSINIHRGCFGGCSFCTISAHQGKFVISRSTKSIVTEIKKVSNLPDFKGYLSDLGGPSANMYMMKGDDQSMCKKCTRPSCIYPRICKNLNTTHQPLLDLYKEVAKIPTVKKAWIGSGIRYDLFLTEGIGDKKINHEYLREVVLNHTSGRLKVAPEHTSPNVLKWMRKPDFSLFKKLNDEFQRIIHSAGIKYQLIPYFISSHPGSTEQDMAQLAEETKRLNFRLEQVQDFTPTPMTLASTIFYSGVDPYSGEKVFVAKSPSEKEKQRSYFFWYQKENSRKEYGTNTGRRKKQ